MGRLTNENLAALRENAEYLPTDAIKRMVVRLLDEIDALRARLRLAEAVVEAARTELADTRIRIVGNTLYIGRAWAVFPGGPDITDAQLRIAQSGGMPATRAALAALDAEREGEK